MEPKLLLVQSLHDKIVSIKDGQSPIINYGNEEYGLFWLSNEVAMAVNFLRSGCPSVLINIPQLHYTNISDERKDDIRAEAIESIEQLLQEFEEEATIVSRGGVIEIISISS